ARRPAGDRAGRADHRPGRPRRGLAAAPAPRLGGRRANRPGRQPQPHRARRDGRPAARARPGPADPRGRPRPARPRRRPAVSPVGPAHRAGRKTTMTHVLRAHARIAATTKIAVPGVLAMAAFVVLTSLAPAVLFGQHRDPHTVLEGTATVAAVTAMLLGTLQTAGDLQNGMTRALLLVEPGRLRVLGAQLLVSLGLGAGVGVAAALLADSTQAGLGRL